MNVHDLTMDGNKTMLHLTKTWINHAEDIEVMIFSCLLLSILLQILYVTRQCMLCLLKIFRVQTFSVAKGNTLTVKHYIYMYQFA